MKLAVAIADTNALPTAFVVFRGLETSIRKAQELGYDGIELALKRADEVDRRTLASLLDETGLEVSCISTGQVYADLGLSFTETAPDKRAVVRDIFKDLIELAAEFGHLVNIGRVRGQIGTAPKEDAEQRFIDMARELCEYAAPRGVTLILEPVNRYEIDFINSVAEGADLMQKVGMPNMKLMPDVFHMNIEDVTIGGELARNIEYVAYIHFADSNRFAPGQGHTDFPEILRQLKAAGYDGWVSIEILPKPDPDTAARQAAAYLRPLIDDYNRG
ncbi:TIM barrel protein [candidate division KSB3 bacterium]|uniref:TIM barrel protein n=1 Tax=candidate division KSB3 bacterium TaxID=2044937 RepID=A0A9D5Q5S4_9BACT|nr:TIM barrel protein [candidate division KSB3 bacterium]MBD3324166.1 TIM barrel protein [candidate division KSB3 bacterium]